MGIMTFSAKLKAFLGKFVSRSLTVIRIKCLRDVRRRVPIDEIAFCAPDL